MGSPYFILFLIVLVIWLVHSSKQKKKRQQAKTEFYALEQISKEELSAWLPFDEFEILNKFDSYQISELSKGEFKGFKFVTFLYSYSTQEGQCFRQTVTAIKLDQKVDTFCRNDEDVWVESHGEIVVVYKEKQSMTCGAPIELFLNRAVTQSKVLT